MTRTGDDIKGMSYALYQMPEDTEGTYAVIKVLNVPTANEVARDTPLHLCDPSKLITQHRLGDRRLPFRTIDPTMYYQHEIDWYETGVLPPPLYMCFIYALKCYLCGETQTSGDDIYGEMTENFKEGYRFCTNCAPYVRQALYKTLAPIWRFRLESERACADGCRVPIWVHRTRRDESGKTDRTNSGRPFRYTRWFVSSWISRKSINRHDPNVEPFEEDKIWVEEWNATGDAMCKMVSVMDVFFANRGSLRDPNYDPNADDPLNQVRHLTIDEKREIMRQESAPFE